MSGDASTGCGRVGGCYWAAAGRSLRYFLTFADDRIGTCSSIRRVKPCQRLKAHSCVVGDFFYFKRVFIDNGASVCLICRRRSVQPTFEKGFQFSAVEKAREMSAKAPWDLFIQIDANLTKKTLLCIHT